MSYKRAVWSSIDTASFFFLNISIFVVALDIHMYLNGGDVVVFFVPVTLLLVSILSTELYMKTRSHAAFAMNIGIVGGSMLILSAPWVIIDIARAMAPLQQMYNIYVYMLKAGVAVMLVAAIIANGLYLLEQLRKNNHSRDVTRALQS